MLLRNSIPESSRLYSFAVNLKVFYLGYLRRLIFVDQPGSTVVFKDVSTMLTTSLLFEINQELELNCLQESK